MKQTCSALVTALHCPASPTEDFLSRSYENVLTSRSQKNPLQLMFFKISTDEWGQVFELREMVLSECVEVTTSFLKESVYIRPRFKKSGH